jgi:hypothetical protein
LAEGAVDPAAEAALDAGPRRLLGGRVPFFLGAFPKSGTTWLQVMLDAHPQVACRGEGHLMNMLAPRLTELVERQNGYIETKNTTLFAGIAAYPRLGDGELRHLIATAVALSLAQLPEGPDVRAVGEKTPDNVFHFPLLRRLFPAARFVHIVRDGRDCAVSAWFHNHRIDPAAAKTKFGTFEQFVEGVATAWVRCMAAGRQFAAAAPERCVVLSYERLVADPDEGLRAIFTLLGVDTGAATLAECRRLGAFEQMTGGRRPGETDESSFLRHGLPGDWRRHFSAEASRRFEAIGGGLLAELGYR